MGKTVYDTTELSVCTVCIHLLANGEYNDGTDAAEVAAAGKVRIWGDDARHLTPGGEDLGHCTSDCDGCGDSEHGDRFRAYVMIPGPSPWVFINDDCRRAGRCGCGFCKRDDECGYGDCRQPATTHHRRFHYSCCATHENG